jgi:hypothetical protein
VASVLLLGGIYLGMHVSQLGIVGRTYQSWHYSARRRAYQSVAPDLPSTFP